MKFLVSLLSEIGGQSHDGTMRHAVEPAQTKAPIYGDHISSLKAQAMKQAKDRRKHLARPGPASNPDFLPFTLDKLEPEFVSNAEIAEVHTRPRRRLLRLFLLG